MKDINEKRPCVQCGYMFRSRKQERNHFCSMDCRVQYKEEKRNREYRDMIARAADPNITKIELQDIVSRLAKDILVLINK